jgi:hypothetical protein
LKLHPEYYSKFYLHPSTATKGISLLGILKRRYNLLKVSILVVEKPEINFGFRAPNTLFSKEAD